jgi:hypothetical protein
VALAAKRVFLDAGEQDSFRQVRHRLAAMWHDDDPAGALVVLSHRASPKVVTGSLYRCEGAAARQGVDSGESLFGQATEPDPRPVWSAIGTPMIDPDGVSDAAVSVTLNRALQRVVTRRATGPELIDSAIAEVERRNQRDWAYPFLTLMPAGLSSQEPRDPFVRKIRQGCDRQARTLPGRS